MSPASFRTNVRRRRPGPGLNGARPEDHGGAPGQRHQGEADAPFEAAQVRDPADEKGRRHIPHQVDDHNIQGHGRARRQGPATLTTTAVSTPGLRNRRNIARPGPGYRERGPAAKMATAARGKARTIPRPLTHRGAPGYG